MKDSTTNNGKWQEKRWGFQLRIVECGTYQMRNGEEEGGRQYTHGRLPAGPIAGV
jgi:hypothetical protein